MATIIDKIYENLPKMSSSDQKIAHVVLKDSSQIVDMTISKLAKSAKVSDASVTRFCHNLGLTGFHDLKIQLAQIGDGKEQSLSEMPQDDIQQSLLQISQKKEDEIKASLTQQSSKTIDSVLDILKKSCLIQVNAEGDTYPVASDAVYKFNQIGLISFSSGGDEATAIAQTLNLSSQDCLLVISNSGESVSILKQVKIAKEKKIPVIAITNRSDSPIALEADYHLKTAVRQTVLQTQYYFSRVSAMTIIEALFLLLINEDKERIANIRKHEEIISNQKI